MSVGRVKPRAGQGWVGEMAVVEGWVVSGSSNSSDRRGIK